MQRFEGGEVTIRDEVISVTDMLDSCLHFDRCHAVRLERVTFVCSGLPEKAATISGAREVTMRDVRVTGASVRSAIEILGCHTVTIERIALDPDRNGYAGGLLLLAAEPGEEIGRWRVQGVRAEGLRLHPRLTDRNVDVVLVHNARDVVLVGSTFQDIDPAFDSAFDIGWKPDDARLPPGLAIVRDCELVRARRAKVTGYASTDTVGRRHRAELRKLQFTDTRFEPYYGADIECEVRDTRFSETSASPIRLGSSSKISHGDLTLIRVKNETGHELVDQQFSTGTVTVLGDAA